MIFPKPFILTPQSFTVKLCWITLFLNTALPKGGFYLGDIPITWGYLSLGLCGLLLTVKVLLNLYRLNKRHYLQFFLLFLFFVYSAASFALVGTNESQSFSSVFSYLVSILVIPICSILVGSYLIRKVGTGRLIDLLRFSLGIIIVWGAISFISLNTLNKPWGVPYLTFTGADAASLLEKHINRGNVYKMISTYNNGNILGINLLIWLPLALCASYPVRVRLRASARVVLLLTLSRTVWAGWLLYEFLSQILNRRTSSRMILGIIVAFLLFILIIVVAGIWFDNPLTFIFDPTLGGRVSYTITGANLFNISPQPFAGILEIVYVWMIRNFGIPGLLLFVAAWFFPLSLPARTVEMRCAKVGLVIYIILMLSDGAFVYVPTQFSYWVIAGLILANSGRQTSLTSTTPAESLPNRKGSLATKLFY